MDSGLRLPQRVVGRSRRLGISPLCDAPGGSRKQNGSVGARQFRARNFAIPSWTKDLSAHGGARSRAVAYLIDWCR